MGIVNSAMMRVSSYHKKKGDEVEIYNPFNTYDKVYAFSLFRFTPKHYVTQDMICGGTGFDIHKKLPPEIEAEDYDWSLYPDCDFSVIWFSTGCTRKCPFCVVPQKEGEINSVEPKNLNPKGLYIKIQDNNFFANPKWKEAIAWLKATNQKVEFAGGVDARTLDKEKCEAMLSLKHEKQIKLAWDNPRENLLPKLKEIVQYVKPSKLMCFVLIGYWSSQEEDLMRVEALRGLGIDPFVMPYDRTVKYQRDFARWANFKAIFKSVSWKEYKPSIEVREK